MNLFENFGLSDQLLTSIKELGITKPTQIQELAIPHIMSGEDVIGESATGSGKTLAFGCGITDQVVPRGGLQALILAPTRELAEQVKTSLRQLGKQKRLGIVTICGGVAINPQVRDLTRAEVVVATPGRLLDHIKRGTIQTSKIKLLVLDEADRMFDMGFIEDVEKIIRACPSKRQTLFFSATISLRVKDLARKFMNSPKKVSAVNLVDPSKLKQVYYDIQKNMKLSLLVHLLQNEKSGLVMVFCNTRRNADFVYKALKANKISAIAIHGGLSQNKRTRTIDLFNNARVGVLVCTDVAARGLHIDNVSHVYNYDIPKDPQDYIHRIGRTARAGEEGIAINVLCDYDYPNFSRIQGEYTTFTIRKAERPYLKRVSIPMSDERRRFSGNGRRFSNNRGRSPSNGRRFSNNSRGRSPGRRVGRRDSFN